jgi:catechol 2,3-dioxygenase-like lactoylglutathione lyase family enzyme
MYFRRKESKAAAQLPGGNLSVHYESWCPLAEKRGLEWAATAEGARMTVLNRMIGFLTTSDAEKAKAFYGDVLGFRFVKDDGFALVFDASGTMLRIAKAKAHTPAQGTVLGWEVDDMHAAVRDLSARGVHFEQFGLAFMKQDEMGVWEAPGGDQVAWFKDPDGNTLSISKHQKQNL